MKLDREKTIDALLAEILGGGHDVVELLHDALVNGRTGFQSMTDSELLDACEVWGVSPV